MQVTYKSYTAVISLTCRCAVCCPAVQAVTKTDRVVQVETTAARPVFRPAVKLINNIVSSIRDKVYRSRADRVSSTHRISESLSQPEPEVVPSVVSISAEADVVTSPRSLPSAIGILYSVKHL